MSAMNEPCPPEASPQEWAKWSDETRYLFLERLGLGADREVALEQARRNHRLEQAELFS